MLSVMCGPISVSVTDAATVAALDDEQSKIFERNLGSSSIVTQS